MSKEYVYILSPVRLVTPEQTEAINNHKKSLAELSDTVVFNPKEDAPQEDKTGYNIVMAELNFMKKAALEGGRVDALWNKGGIPSEGSRVDLGMAYALGLRIKLITVFNEQNPTGPQIAFEILKEIAESKKNTPLLNWMDKIIKEIDRDKGATINWQIWGGEKATDVQEWQRIRLGLALGRMVRVKGFKIKMGELIGEDPVDKKSYPKVIKEIENRQQTS